MSQPLYFLPGVHWSRGQSLSVTRSIIREAGLADIFNDVSEDHVGFAPIDTKGPGDKSGTIICYVDNREPPRRQGYYPAEQKWSAVGDGSQLWIGLDKDEKPTPEQLQRRRVHPGYTLELGDGQRYTIPVVRRPDGTTNLPTDMVFDAAGKLQEPIKPAYERYWESSAEVLSWFSGGLCEGDGSQLDKSKLLRHCLEVLSISYRVGPVEQNALRLVDGTNWSAILWASIDGPAMLDRQEAQKKT